MLSNSSMAAGGAFWPVLLIANIAALIASRAMTTATFSCIKQSTALGCFPRLKIIHTSRKFMGQIYIPVINWFLLVVCLVFVCSISSNTEMGNAYGTASSFFFLGSQFLYASCFIHCWCFDFVYLQILSSANCQLFVLMWDLEGCFNLLIFQTIFSVYCKFMNHTISLSRLLPVDARFSSLLWFDCYLVYVRGLFCVSNSTYMYVSFLHICLSEGKNVFDTFF